MNIIEAQSLSVSFPVFSAVDRSLKTTLLKYATGGYIEHKSNSTSTVRALNNLTFTVKEGDRIGLSGHNGSGKTTLLRTIAGVYEPTSGALSVKGSVTSLLDISLGMEAEATGYENIILRGLMLGKSLKEIRSRTDEIAEFTELGHYLNYPVRTYSSGMQMRLAFAVSTSWSSDILLMDEWLSVGDASFQEKAEVRLRSLLDETKVIIIATHSMALIENLCNRHFSMQAGTFL